MSSAEFPKIYYVFEEIKDTRDGLLLYIKSLDHTYSQNLGIFLDL